MIGLQRLGGFAALFEAAAFIFGLGFYFAVLGPAQYGSANVEAVRHVAFLATHQPLLTLWNLVIYVAFGAFLVLLALALHDRVKGAAPILAQTATAFALIWAGLVIASGMVANIGMGAIVDLYGRNPAEAALVWRSYGFVVGGLGGGNEIVGGLWVLLISLAAWRTRALPRLVSGLGLVVSVAGLLTTIPALTELGTIFGLGLIVWFAALGVVLLRGDRNAGRATSEPAAPPALPATALDGIAVRTPV